MVYDPGRLDDLSPDNTMLLIGMAGESLVNCMADGEAIGPRTLEALVYLLQEDRADSPRLAGFLATLAVSGVLDEARIGLPLEVIVAKLEEDAP